MNTSSKSRNVLIATGLIVLIVLVGAWLLYPSKSKLGDDWGLQVMYIFARYAGLYIGIAFIAFRCLQYLLRWNTFLPKFSATLSYIFIAVLNTLLGIFTVGLYVFHAASVSWLHLYLLNLLIGVVMLSDTFLLSDRE